VKKIKKTMTKQELIEQLATKEGMPKTKAEEIVNFIIDTITKAMIKGDEVVITGFGKFVVVKKAAREGRNPKTGETVTIPAKTVPKFRPGKALKEAVK
jgi:DNA-binding protein HU-beta